MADIRAVDLIAKAQYALDNKWGYIYGAYGQIWTQASQNTATREQTKLYGQQWVGKHVLDCSGLFYWAFKELGGYMYHGSNTMYKSYCTNKGKLSKGARTDGQNLKPGTAIFTGTSESEHGHVGLYIGGGYVIEAQGTKAGVIKSKITLSKWTYWGELKGVIYDVAIDVQVPSAPAADPTPTPTTDTNVKSALVTGTRLALRAAPSTSATVLTRVNTGERVQILDDPDWVKVKYQGKTGYMMAKYLQF